MSRASQVEDFMPARAALLIEDIEAALADLDPDNTWLGLTIPLPYTRRADGTIDAILIGPYRPGTDWVIYMGRDYTGRGHANVTAEVARCPGYMVVLVVRALHAHLTTVGPQGRADTVEGDILHALGLTRVAEEATR